MRLAPQAGGKIKPGVGGGGRLSGQPADTGEVGTEQLQVDISLMSIHVSDE